VAEFLSPGVFIEEVPSAVQTIAAVSTSNMGIVGFTSKGPTDEATLVTSSDQFYKKFGALTRNSFLPLSVLAFFANGGRRAFVVRVVPSDAVEADADLQSKQYDQQIETGDNVVVAFSKTAGTTTLKVNSGATPVVGKSSATGAVASFGIRWRETGTPVTTDPLRDRDDLAGIVNVTGQASYEFRIAPASIPAEAEGDLEQFAVVPDTAGFTLNYDFDGATPATIAVGAPVSGTTATFTNASGSVLTFDYATGRGSIKFGAAEIPVIGGVGIALTGDFTPTTTTKSIADDGAGALVDVTAGALAAPGTIDYNDGSYSFTTAAAPHKAAPLLCTYFIAAWSLDPISKGAWADDVKVRVSGNLDNFTAATQSYSKHDMLVLEYNASTGAFDVVETYEELDFSDSTAAQYFPDVINELSDYIQVDTPGADEHPGSLDGLSVTTVLGGGDELAAGQTFGGTLGAVLLPTYLSGQGLEVGPRSVTISYTGITSGALSITDDGAGNLVGAVDSTYATSITVGGVTIGPNEIDYATGVANFKTDEAIEGGTLVTATFYTEAEAANREEQFGDTSKIWTDSLATVHYTAGSDGSFTGLTYSRSEFTAPTLIANKRGLYAFDEIDEILQVVIPDFAGDTVVTVDLLDYAESRANLPSGGDRFIILTVPQGSDPQEAVDWFRYDLGRFSKWAALYWPWVKVADPLANNRPLTMPPLGHIAGIYARTDSNKNVGKAPGGTVDGALTFLLGLEYVSSQGERDYVYPNRVNPLISSPQTGLAVWGVRTLSQESEWRYINARRTFMFMEKSVYNATGWIVFENNGPGLWSRIKAQLDGFMQGLFNEGLFYGASPSQAYFVIVDETNNDASSIEAGQVIIDVGAAPNRPAEFVRFRFQQQTIG